LVQDPAGFTLHIWRLVGVRQVGKVRYFEDFLEVCVERPEGLSEVWEEMEGYRRDKGGVAL
jgi:hypothetical protein